MLSSSTDKLEVKFERDKLKGVTSKQSSNFFLEVIDHGRLGSARSNQLNRAFLTKKALASSEFGDRAGYSYHSKQALPKVALAGQALQKIRAEELIKLGEDLIQSLKQEDPKILVSCYMDLIQYQEKLETSLALYQIPRASSLSIYVEGELVKPGDILNIGDYFAWRDNVFDKAGFIGDLKRKFSLAKRTVKATSGEYTVIFAPEVFSTLLEFLETALNAETVYKKVSKWTDRLSQPVADARFSLTDDPTVDFAMGSGLYDDEGAALKPLELIKAGRLVNFYSDLKNAQRLGIEANGRGFGIPAQPALTNIVVTPGDKTLPEIIKGTQKGILIDQVIGGGQDNPYAGDFSFSINLGFLIDGGKLTGRVKNAMVSGNIFEMLLDKLGEISKERIWYGGSQLLPHISFTDTIVVSQK